MYKFEYLENSPPGRTDIRLFFHSSEDKKEFEKSTPKLNQNSARVTPELKEDDRFRKSAPPPRIPEQSETGEKFWMNVEKSVTPLKGNTRSKQQHPTDRKKQPTINNYK